MTEGEFPILDRFGMLLMNNNRSKAYVQHLVESGFKPAYVVVLQGENRRRPEQTDFDLLDYAETKQKVLRSVPSAGVRFDEKEHITSTLRSHGIPFDIIPTEDVNSDKTIAALKASDLVYWIYSGPGGAILREGILSIGKNFIHAHSGLLPDYRGSTTIYYALLTGDPIGCSVIFFNQGIDTGPIFYKRAFEFDHQCDIDYVFDPAIRAATLSDFLQINYGKVPSPIVQRQNESEGNQFFIIHPVLKHLAILKSKKA